MLEILKNSEGFKEACKRAGKRAIEQECTVYVAYVARYDKWKTSDWYDDASVCRFDECEEIEWL